MSGRRLYMRPPTHLLDGTREPDALSAALSRPQPIQNPLPPPQLAAYQDADPHQAQLPDMARLAHCTAHVRRTPALRWTTTMVYSIAAEPVPLAQLPAATPHSPTTSSNLSDFSKAGLRMDAHGWNLFSWLGWWRHCTLRRSSVGRGGVHSTGTWSMQRRDMRIRLLHTPCVLRLAGESERRDLVLAQLRLLRPANIVTDAVADYIANVFSNRFADAFADSFANAVADIVAFAFPNFFSDAFADLVADPIADALADSFANAVADFVALAFANAFTDALADFFADRIADAFTDISADLPTDAFPDTSADICPNTSPDTLS